MKMSKPNTAMVVVDLSAVGSFASVTRRQMTEAVTSAPGGVAVTSRCSRSLWKDDANRKC